jgi:two-component system, cell cycle sensor histidine kinase and response regulator CckA
VDAFRGEALADAGRVAVEVAHDLNNVLLGIQALATMLEGRLPEGTVEHEDAVEILRATEHGAAIVRQLVTLGGGGPGPAEPLRVDAALDEVGRLLDHLAGKTVHLAVDVPAELPPVRFDGCALVRIVANLVRNAGEAMPNGGVVSVRAAANDGRVVLTVSDTGPGIAHEDLPRIFEPFYSTKRRGANPGIGLASVYELARANGADIRVASTPGGGATFEIDLPVWRN